MHPCHKDTSFHVIKPCLAVLPFDELLWRITNSTKGILLDGRIYMKQWRNLLQNVIVLPAVIRFCWITKLSLNHGRALTVCYEDKVIASGARSAERILRGLVEKSKHERPGTARHDTTRPRDAFDELISLQPWVWLTNGLLWWVAASLLPSMEPPPILLGSHCGTCKVRGCKKLATKLFTKFRNGWTDSGQIWCVLRDQAGVHITQVMGGVHLYLGTSRSGADPENLQGRGYH